MTNYIYTAATSFSNPLTLRNLNLTLSAPVTEDKTSIDAALHQAVVEYAKRYSPFKSDWPITVTLFKPDGTVLGTKAFKSTLND